jgi:predicted RNase H-like HicB family nuclease
MRQVLIYPGEDGFWVAECPTLPGCISQGTSREEAIQNAREAIQVYIAALEEDGLPVPEDSLEESASSSNASREAVSSYAERAEL